MQIRLKTANNKHFSERLFYADNVSLFTTATPYYNGNISIAQMIDCMQNSGRLHEWDVKRNSRTEKSPVDSSRSKCGARVCQSKHRTQLDRLRFVLGEKFAGYYGYDANGERVYKLTGTSVMDQVNSGSTKAQAIFDDAVLYPNPYIVISQTGYTKHYYAGTERLATVIGGGGFGDMDAPRDKPTQREQEIVYAFDKQYQQSDPFWQGMVMSYPVPTENVEREQRGELDYICEPTILDYVDVQFKWDILLGSIMQYTQANGPENEVYFYHGDHLGSANWITDYTGAPVQYIHYAPYGELIDNQVPYGYDERYKFTGKERDWETGYDYFGARYWWLGGTWLSVDPLADKYPNISPYAYAAWNPVKFVDPDGRIVVFAPGTTNDQKNQFNQALDHLDSHGRGGRYAQLERSEYTYTIIVDDSGISQFDGTDRNNPVIHWSPKKGVKTKNGTVMSPSTVLDHEMDHGCAFDKAKQQLDKGNVEAWNEYAATTKPGTSADYGKKEEERVITGVEQTTAQALGEVEPGKVTRTDHSGSYVWVNGPTSNKPIE